MRDRCRGEYGGQELNPPSLQLTLKLRWTKGEMAERSNAAVLKTVVLYPRDRGFESLFLRITNYSPGITGGFLF